MSAAAFVLMVCVGLSMAAPQGAVFQAWKSVNIPAVSVAHVDVSASHAVPVKTVSVSHDVVSPPHEFVQTKAVITPLRSEVSYVKSHDKTAAVQAWQTSQTRAALDSAGASLFRALGNAATGLGGFLSSLANSAASLTKTVVVPRTHTVVVEKQQPVVATTYDNDRVGVLSCP